MGDPVTINIRHLSRGLGIQLGQVQSVLELLDEGNTVPFITRYRKDQTGGLDEEQIRLIQDRLEKMRLLAERKQTILRSIESQGKLTEELDKRIRSANTAKRLEDLYLPYKPKKQTLAQLARSRGLETLADEIINRSPTCSDLDRRAADFVNPDRGVPTAADALLGAGHILAERFSENVELRQRLREILQRSGKIASCRVGGDEKAATAPTPAPAKAEKPAPPTAPRAPEPAAESPGGPPESKAEDRSPSPIPETPPSAPAGDASAPSPELAVETPEVTDSAPPVAPDEDPPVSGAPDVGDAPGAGSGEATPPATPQSTDEAAESPQDEQRGSGMGGGTDPAESAESSRSSKEEPEGAPSASSDAAASPATPSDSTEAAPQTGESSPPKDDSPPKDKDEVSAAESTPTAPESSAAEDAATGPVAQPPTASEAPQGPDAPLTKPASEAASDAPSSSPAPAKRKPRTKGSKRSNAERKADRKRQKKQKAEEKKQKAFSDYFDYSEELRKIPPHRVLAINRGDRAKVLRVKVECDQDGMNKVVDELSVPADHPHAEFLRGCARDALIRLVLPSLEREARRELTERAETHAVGVFAKNLRNLLLQPPVHDRRVLAVDPGFKSGCKLVALDQFGNVLAHAVIYLIGKPERKEEAKKTVVELMERFKLTVVAIGNGTACRETEDFFGEILAEANAGGEWAYVIVNEAGASVYSTSSLGREEFPEYDATLRGAISIGRRLQDPLSELVKIDPANIGVGLYQHDVKAKHLRESLDDVVSSCVNFVGVDVNTASPALLRYVSGLNQLTARRVYEHRMQNGPFRNREQLRTVTGFGEAAFVQSAGFLKIANGDNPLDRSWIHPESYEVVRRVLERLGCDVDDLLSREKTKGLSEKAAEVDATALAEELGVGLLLLKDILAQLVRPGRDPREDLPQPVFRHGVLKLEDLTAGMELTGTVLNVVDFGVFVDIGMHDSGLVHVSQLADKFVRDPHEVAAVGDIVKVWVLDVDKARRRVSLTMIPPGTPRTSSRREDRGGGRRGDRARQDKKPREQRRDGQRDGGRGRGRGRDGGQGRGRTSHYKPKSRPKPVTPITDEMRDGREPMRSFSDLAQFFSGAEPEPEKPKKAKKQKRKSPKTDKSQDSASEPQPDAQASAAGQEAAPAEPPPAQSEVPPPTDSQESSQNDHANGEGEKSEEGRNDEAQ